MRNIYGGEMVNIVETFEFPELIKENYSNAALEDRLDEPFYVCNVGDIVQKCKLWNERLPRIKPFYAMKCNPNSVVVNLLAKMHTGFDCASKNEIECALEAGVPADSIIYANPCKPISHIKYAESVGVRMMTFDSVLELKKVAIHHPSAQMVIRIFVGSSLALCPLGLKFGTELVDVPSILETALNLNVNVVGVSFHVGSGCFDASAYSMAIRMSKDVFNLAKSMGFNMNILDIGGGFPGNIDTIERIEFFDTVCATINECIEHYFPERDVTIIAEPGRFYVSSAFQLVCNVTSIRTSPSGVSDDKIHYFLNDGVYGSFNCTVFDHYIGEHYLLNDYQMECDSVLYESVFWGPTCDSFDKILDKTFIRKINIGEGIIFKNMGAYTMAAGCTFNGFPKPFTIYYCSLKDWEQIEPSSPLDTEDIPQNNSMEVIDAFDCPQNTSLDLSDQYDTSGDFPY